MKQDKIRIIIDELFIIIIIINMFITHRKIHLVDFSLNHLNLRRTDAQSHLARASLKFYTKDAQR